MKKQGYDEETVSYASSMIPVEEPALVEARKVYEGLFEKYTKERAEEKQKVLEAGGLHVIGTERYESRRVDNQLRGRSGRQGDPGSSRFYVSLEDPLMRLFGGERVQNMVQKMGLEEDEPIEANMLTRTIENAQKKVEGRNFSIRKYILQYDNVMTKQREVIYKERAMVLDGEDLREHLFNMLDEMVGEYVESTTLASKYQEEWDMDELQKNIDKICHNSPDVHYADVEEMSVEDLKDRIMEDYEKIYEAKEEEVGAEQIREVERGLLLRIVDSKWIDHIDAMDQLK